MRSVLRWTLAALLVLGASAPARAQEAGDRVRVTVTDGPRVVGRFERADADTLVLVGRDSIRRVIPLANVGRLDVARGKSRTRGIVRGAAIGLGVGAVIGAVLGSQVPDGGCQVSHDAFCFDIDDEIPIVIGGMFLGGIGMVAGGTYGALRSPTRWVAVPGTSRVRVGARTDGGVALGVNIPLR